jgi:hypothetical protein
VLVKSLGDALQAAIDAKVPFSSIAHELKSRGAHFQRMHDDQIERRSRNPNPVMYDPLMLAPIDYAGQSRRAEEKRIARELHEQQRQYAESVNQRAIEDARRQGKVL